MEPVASGEEVMSDPKHWGVQQAANAVAHQFVMMSDEYWDAAYRVSVIKARMAEREAERDPKATDA